MHQWQTPYTTERAGFFLFWRYNVLFDDTPLFVNFDHETAKRIAGALNGAYNLGYMAKQTELENGAASQNDFR